jgi:hypothetical protein
MDGRIRFLTTFASMYVIAAWSAACPVVGDDVKRKANESALYASPELEKEFLGAVSVDLRIKASTAAPSCAAKLELRSKNSEKFPRYKTKVVSISLSRRTESNSSHADGTTEPSEKTYVVSGLPSDFLKPNQSLTLKLTSEGDEGEEAELLLSGGESKEPSSVKLSRVRLPKESVKLKAAKPGSPD